jgi:hypothetical protein
MQQLFEKARGEETENQASKRRKKQLQNQQKHGGPGWFNFIVEHGFLSASSC